MTLRAHSIDCMPPPSLPVELEAVNAAEPACARVVNAGNEHKERFADTAALDAFNLSVDIARLRLS